MFGKLEYTLTFLGEPEFEHGEDGLPPGEELARLLKVQLSQADFDVTNFGTLDFSWHFVIAYQEVVANVELQRVFGRDEWELRITYPSGCLPGFYEKPEREADKIASLIEGTLKGTGRYHSFKWFYRGKDGGTPWDEHPGRLL